ncbi:excitatory amino acid transporter 1-like isoform X2 [Rhopilema esculentum]|uniref:excitatory amino acid transporter 1-like isoform X2 n=1 Tax=Rhopilema esculentum TaxID=499914 RepID=UPI0031DDFDFA|eukprot:gene4764-21068_t
MPTTFALFTKPNAEVELKKPGSDYNPKNGGPNLDSHLKTEAPPERQKPKWRRIIEKDLLMFLIIIAVVLGFIIGISINKRVQSLEEPDKTTALVLIGFLGELLMRMLKLLILPLIVSSLIVGMAALDQQASGRLGRRAICYYMGTTILAVILGIILVLIINPGGKAAPNTEKKKQRDVIPLDSVLDLIRNLFPPNIVAACFEQTKSAVNIITKKTNVTVNDGNRNSSRAAGRTILTEIINSSYTKEYYVDTKRTRVSGSVGVSSGTNVLGLVVFSLAVGVVVGRMKGKKESRTHATTFINFVIALNDIVMYLVTLVMWYSPIGIWSLITAKFAAMENIAATFESLGMYIVTVIVGLAIHSLIVLPGLYFLFTRKNPLSFLEGIIQAMLTAFGTSSSSATLPVTFRCLEENNHIDKRVTRFVLPIGATINMDGTALYEAVAAIFIAQASNFSLNFGQIVMISLTSTFASIGAAGIPQAGLVTMLIVLQTVGLPEDGISLIIAVDWFLDRIRTAVNVLGDSIGAGIVDHLSKDDLDDMDHDDMEQDGKSAVYENTQC